MRPDRLRHGPRSTPRPAEQDTACEGCGHHTACRWRDAVPVERTGPDGKAWTSLTVPGWFCAGCRQGGDRG